MSSTSIVDLLFDKLFTFPLRKKECYLLQPEGTWYGDNLYQNIPHEYKQILKENNLLLSEDAVISELSSAYQSSSSLLKCFSHFTRNYDFSKFTFSPHILNLLHNCTHLPQNAMYLTDSIEQFSLCPASEIEKMFSTKNQRHNSDTLSLNIDFNSILLNPLFSPKVEMESEPKVKTMESAYQEKSCAMLDAKLSCGLDKLTKTLEARKAKELSKHSKKRRRRKQSKKRQVTTEVKENKSIDCTENTSSTKPKLNDSKQTDIFIDDILDSVLSSSFIITVNDASDDDSDWDVTEACHWLTEATEFEVSGLFVTNLSPSAAFASGTLAQARCNITTIFSGKNLDHHDDSKLNLLQANKKWENATKHVTKDPKIPSKVSFLPDDELVSIFPVEMYERKGKWEMYAVERDRFKRRIAGLEPILSPCLSAAHREQVYVKLQSLCSK